jgi:hypothetical protein
MAPGVELQRGEPVMSALRLLALALVLALAACATPGKITVAPLWAPALTDTEHKEAATIQAAIERICEAVRRNGQVCTAPSIHVVSDLDHGRYHSDAQYIALPRAVLGLQAAEYRPLVAHELSHHFFEEARCVQPEPRCEMAANYYSAVILHRYFGYTEHAAIRAVWLALAGTVARHATTERRLPGHPDSCAEILAFESRVGITPQYPCRPKT